MILSALSALVVKFISASILVHCLFFYFRQKLLLHLQREFINFNGMFKIPRQMKTFTLIFICCVLSLAAKSQEWAPVGATWHYTEEIFMPVTVDKDYIKFESVKDTMYNGKLCRQITKRHNVSCTDRPGVEYMYSEGEKVWFWDPNFNKFQVLYDFSAGAGDSWVILVNDTPHSDVDSLFVRVDSINTVTINSVQLKRLYVTYDFRNETIIPDTYKGVIFQSVGDMYFMFNYVPEYLFGCDGNFSGGLRCYDDAVIGHFESGIAPSCTFVHQLSGIGTVNVQSSRIRLYPNPADMNVTIESAIPGPVSFSFADVTGRIVKTGQVTGAAIGTCDLQPGIYQVFFSQHGLRLPEYKKLVIQ